MNTFELKIQFFQDSLRKCISCKIIIEKIFYLERFLQDFFKKNTFSLKIKRKNLARWAFFELGFVQWDFVVKLPLEITFTRLLILRNMFLILVHDVNLTDLHEIEGVGVFVHTGYFLLQGFDVFHFRQSDSSEQRVLHKNFFVPRVQRAWNWRICVIEFFARWLLLLC